MTQDASHGGAEGVAAGCARPQVPVRVTTGDGLPGATDVNQGMSEQSRIVSPGPDEGTVRTSRGEVLRPPEGWVLLPPGDAALTRRVKAAGPSWTVQEKRGRKTFSRGVWASGAVVEVVRRELAAERSDPAHARRKEADARRRERAQAEYVETFLQSVLAFLAFHPRHAVLAGRLARAVTEHATPVGSGTVARTRRIPVERRAEAAVIAWMRHLTTAYENTPVPRVKGKRRELRRVLASRSRALLDAYRAGADVDPVSCPLQRALAPASAPSEAS